MQKATWGDDFRELVPPAMLLVAQKVGGLAVGAFDEDDTLAGFVYGLTGPRGGALIHWSHMLAVRRDARDCGVGRALKQHQRARMRDGGVATILWSFDPLVARNAHLNLRRLGARVTDYVENMYGENPMSVTDSVIGSDRLVVEWPTTEQPTAEPGTHDAESAALVFAADDPAEDADLPEAAVVACAIPADIQALKSAEPELARRWRRATRRALQHYLGRGYRIVAFERVPQGGGAYLLVCRSDP
ncbi:MAG: hypothetical protein PVF27_06855 [Gemmatimonadales bacterium]